MTAGSEHRPSIDVVVIGGGYAGVMAANRLTRRNDVTVTLINPRPYFVERIRLHQHVAGSYDPVVEYAEVLAGDVHLVVDTVTHINTSTRSVSLVAGGTVGYDYLVYAVGSGQARMEAPGAAEFAYPIATLDDAERLAGALEALPASAPLTVVGSGPLGLEVATELAEAGRTVTLVCGRLLSPYLHPRARRALAGRLSQLGVTVIEGPGAIATGVTHDTVRLGDGRRLPSRLTIWTTGFTAPDLAARSGLSTDSRGRLLTDETLTSIDDDRIVAAGDSAAPSAVAYRMSCQAANQLGPQAAETVLSRIEGRQPADAEVAFVGECISLGRRTGIVQFARRNDQAIDVHLDGRLGAGVKELVCRSTVMLLASEAKRPGRWDAWMTDPYRRGLLQDHPRPAMKPAEEGSTGERRTA